MDLSDAQIDRYARHIVLREIGGEGQRKLLGAHVAIVGAGWIGAPVIQYLAAAGVGALTIIDDDRVELSNLQRQTLFGSKDVGTLKAQAAKSFVENLNEDVRVTPRTERIDVANADALLGQADVIVDGCDNFETRLIVSDAATRLRTPLVSAAVAEFHAQIGIYRGWEEDQPCYRCFVGDNPGQAEQSCSEQGVLGALVGVIGGLAALEAIRLITGFGDDQTGRLTRIDALSLRIRSARIAKNPGCPTCAA